MPLPEILNQPARPILVAPDKFKGTLAADEVASAIAAGLESIGIASDNCRIADGGEGTIDALPAGAVSDLQTASVSDALGRPTSARIALLDDRSALIESADAIGLTQLGEADCDPLGATTRGVGELIAAAASSGATKVFVAIGGTATTDGGAGAIEVLRERRLVGKRGPLKGCPKIIALCDVRAAWDQAALVFAPQKGAGEQEVLELAARLDALAEQLPKDPRGKLMTGAGGGLAGGLWAAAGGELKSGAAWLLDAADFSPRMLASRAVITGEGTLDAQTLLGKAVGEVATRARQAGVPCHAIVGQMGMTEFDARILDFESWQEASTPAELSAAAAALAPVLASY